MHVILLAAGTATRLQPLTNELPKCLLDVGGRTILSRAVSMLAGLGLRRFTVVDGFFGQLVRQALRDEFPDEWFTFVSNRVYASTNNAYSLMLAERELNEPVFLLDSDIVFEEAVVRRLLDDPHPNRLVVRTRGELGDEEIKTTMGDDGMLRDIGKHIPLAKAQGESVGLEVFSPGFCRDLFTALRRRMLHERRVNEWYEATFAELIMGGAEVFAVDQKELQAMEIDTIEDLERARQMVSNFM